MKNKFPLVLLGLYFAILSALLSMAIPFLSRYYLANGAAILAVIVAIVIAATIVVLWLHRIVSLSEFDRAIECAAIIGQVLVVLRSLTVIVQLLFY